MTGERPRLVALCKQLSGHSSACFRELVDQGADLLVVARSATPDAPFDDQFLTAGFDCVRWSEAPAPSDVERLLGPRIPDALLVVSWDVGGYRRYSRAMKGKTLRVLCMDNQWLGTMKQWAGRLASPVLIQPTYDVAFLPGERQAAFARRLGFSDDRIMWGLNCCDHDRFASVAHHGGGPKAFAFVGRLASEKGIDTLVDAYRQYRSASTDPWPLLVAGTGPLETMLSGVEGIEDLGFVQPSEVPAVLGRASCLVLPSRFEPWGVVIQEAAAAGLAVVCTTACGASERFVLDGYNGRVVPSDDVRALSAALKWIADAGSEEQARMARASQQLAAQVTPQRWARYVLERVDHYRHTLALDRV